MNPNFAFPRATPRPQPVQPPSEPVNRESNALRASVLDAALELGLGTNNTVANWMFNNALDEEEEEPEEDLHTRAPLSPTSEESAPYSTPPTSIESYSEAPQAVPPSPHVQFPNVPAVAPTAPAAAPAPNKLRKQRRENGYESDGGYVSDGGKKATFRARTKSKPKAPDPAVVYPISEPMELIPMTKEERKRQKKAAKGGKDNGAETDAEDVPKVSKSKSTKKTKKGSTDAGAGYETDDGYVSSSGKSKKGRRFFSLRKKNDSASEPMPEPMPVPPMPEREVFDLPIASRFATALLPPSAAPSVPPSRAETPLPPPSRPFASASGSSSPSVSSAASSLLTPADQETFPTSPRVGPLEDDVSAVSPHQKSPSSGVTPTEQQSKSKFFIFGRKDNPDSPPKKQTPAPILLSPNTNGSLNSRSPSPMGSPFVLLTPINTNNSRAPSPAPSASTEVVASTDFVVPSRSTSPLPPSPNVLSYYDVPPPSPPPTGPLPRPPPPSAMRESPGPGVARLRSMSRDRINPGIGGRHSPLPPDSRSVSPGPWSASGATSALATSPMTPASARSPVSPIQRGRAAPFPAQPILQTRPPNNGLGPGLADRVKVERYRDLYALNIPDAPRFRKRDADETSVNIEVDEGSDGEDDAEIAGVLGRFREPTARERDGGNAVALERNNSGVLRAGGRQRVVRFSPEPSPTREAYPEEDDDASRYPDDERTAGRRTMYRFDNGSSDGEGAGVRDTVYSEYSRASFMDVGKSEAARGRLVDRVGAMYDQNGRELRRSPVPPVPRLPPELLGGANRF